MQISSSRRPQVALAPTAPEQEPVAAEIDDLEATEETSVGPGDRIGHFVRGVTHESLQQLRYISAANAFQKVGSTVGSLALTPVAIKVAQDSAPLIGGLAIGGTIAAGAIGAAAGYAWLHHRDGKMEESGDKQFSKLHDTVLDIGTTLKSLPNIIYPSVVGGTDAQIETIYSALDELPLHHATASSTIQIVPNLIDTGISGMSQPGDSHVHILFDESWIDKGRKGLIFHEQGHAVDYSGGFGLVGAHNWRGGFGKGPFVSSYAESNRYEDFAESYEAFHLNPDKFRAEFPEKAAAIERLSHADLVTKAADGTKARDLGRRTGKALGKVPYLRTGVELAGSLIAPIQLHRGASKLVDGLESGDKKKELDGKLNLASGLFLSVPGAQPLALATGVAGSAIRATSIEGDGENLEVANRWANRVLATSAGPVGVTVAAMAKELQSNGLKLDSSEGFSAKGWESARPSKGAMLHGTLATVGGTVGGAILGATVGGALSGTGGAVVGALWGQLAGGTVGLAGYSVHRTLKSSRKTDDPLALTGADKAFLGGTAGGAVLGGAVGSIAGAVGGRALGEVVGNAVGGPGAASILGSVGSWTGAVSAGYGAARLGAGLGSGRLLGKGYGNKLAEEAVKLAQESAETAAGSNEEPASETTQESN